MFRFLNNPLGHQNDIQKDGYYRLARLRLMLAAAPISPLPNNTILAGSGTVPVGLIPTSVVVDANPVFGLFASIGAN